MASGVWMGLWLGRRQTDGALAWPAADGWGSGLAGGGRIELSLGRRRRVGAPWLLHNQKTAFFAMPRLPRARSATPTSRVPAEASVADAQTPCRYCLDTAAPDECAADAVLAELILPCLCRDYVHRGCLQRWRDTQPATAQRCATCLAPLTLKHDWRRVGRAAAAVAQVAGAQAAAAPRAAYQVLLRHFIDQLLLNAASSVLAVVLGIAGSALATAASWVGALFVDVLNGGDVLGWAWETLVHHAFLHVVVLPVTLSFAQWRYGAAAFADEAHLLVLRLAPMACVLAIACWTFLPLRVQAAAAAAAAAWAAVKHAATLVAAATTVVAHRSLPPGQ